MSVVYEAIDARLDRRVALKLMRFDEGDADRARLRREAQALAQLSHPNVVEVYEVGEHEGRAFVAMELIDGESLDQWLHQHRRPVRGIVEPFIQAGQGLAAAHAAGLVHRDFKPSNVLVGLDGRVRVVDFGLVHQSGETSNADSITDGSAPPPSRPHAVEESLRSSSLSLRQTWGRNLTRTGAMVGTPAYMSPEQLTGQPVGPASDQFSFCTALFEALFEQHPYVAGDNWPQLPFNVLDGALQPIQTKHSVPAALERVLIRGLSNRPEERWPSMHALLDAITSALRRRRPRPWQWVALAGVGGLTASALALGLSTPRTSRERCEDAAALVRQEWSVHRRDQLREAWSTEALPGAADAWTRADVRLIRYADDWWVAYREVCEVEPPLERQAACLEGRAGGLHAHLAVLADPDEVLVRNVVPMIDRLPAPGGCATINEPTRTDSQIYDAPWAAELQRVDAQLHAGHFDEAQHLLDELRETPKHADDLQLSIRLDLRVGMIERQQGRLDAASLSLEDAYLEAKKLGADEISAEAAITLLKIYGEDRYQSAEAERWRGHARAEVERLGEPRMRSAYLNAAGRALRSKGELEQALDHHKKALELQRKHLPPQHPEVAHSLFQIGSCQGLLGQHAQALQTLEHSLEMYRETLGPRHPDVAGPLTNIGVFSRIVGRGEEALASYHLAKDILEDAFPGNSLYTRFAYINISEIYESQGRFDHAARTLRAYLRGYERTTAEEDFQTAHYEQVSCKFHGFEARYDQAVIHCRRALAAYEEQFGEDHPRVGLARGLLAHTLGMAGDFDEGIVELERSAAILRRSTTSTPNQLANILADMSFMYRAQGEWAAAQAKLEEARDVYVEALGEEHVLVAGTDVTLARLWIDQGRASDALERLRSVIPVLVEGYGAGDPKLVITLATMADAQRLAGDLDAALAQAEQAVDIAETKGGYGPGVDALARFALAQVLDQLGRQPQRATTLAREALEGLKVRGAYDRREREQVEAWLARRATPSP